MSTKPVKIEKGKVGSGVSGISSSISALLANGIAVAGKLVLGQPYTIFSPDDAKALGIDAQYDITNKVIVHHHIDEFYRNSSEGTELNIMIVAQSVTPSVMLTDSTSLYAKKLIAHAKGEVRQIAIAYNPAEAYEETTTDGFNSDIRAAIAPAQAFAAWCFDTYRPLQVILEGRAFSGNATTTVNLRALSVSEGVPLEADKITIVIGQDYDYAEARAWALGKKYAAVGTALGTLSSIRVNEDIGEVGTLNLTNAVLGKFTTAGLSNHKKNQESEDQLETLDTKGYVFAIIHTGISGYRWNGDHVCTPVIVDAEGNMNESTISFGRAFDDAVRKLRVAYLPKVRSVAIVDTATGKMPLGVVSNFNGVGDNVFEDMVAEGLISGGSATTDPNSDLLTGEKELIVAFVVVPTGTINKIKGKINIKKSL